ncbi:MAG: 50S ribosomal protein L11 methyltransferase [Actinomycetota bacterium]
MLALVVTVPAGAAEVAADALWSLGVVAVEERAIEAATGTLELWTSLGDDEQGVRAALAHWPAAWPWRFEHVDDEVVNTWRQFAKPVFVEPDLVVHPAWLSVDPAVVGSAHVLLIEPGSTFGMGDHPTTQLTMRAMRRALAELPHGTARVLDVGCGSGVLAVAASSFGAFEVEAIDIAPASVPTTQANAERNGVGAAVTVSNTPLADVEGTFQVVLANILAPTLIELAPHLQRVVAPGGVLVISGVLAGRHDHVEAALARFHRTHIDELDGWAAVTLRD